MKVSIVVPVLNEREILFESLTALSRSIPAHGDWEVVVVDAGSRDGSAEIAEGFTREKNWKLMRAQLAMPSIGKTLCAGFGECTGSTALVLPCDCRIDSNALTALWSALEKNPEACGGFRKRYDPEPLLMSAYAKIQNEIRARYLRHLVWTNAMFFPLPCTLPQEGFLEDVMLSDALRRLPHWQLVQGEVKVSSRRYYPRRTLRRMLLNVAVITLYRTNLTTPTRLRGLYQSLK